MKWHAARPLFAVLARYTGPMDFKETYRHEVYLSRKDRSRRAFFAAKITGIALALTIGASLRAAPELRGALMTAGMDGIARITNLDQPSAQQAPAMLAADQSRQTPPQPPPQRPAIAQAPKTLPTSKIKINRPATPAQRTARSE